MMSRNPQPNSRPKAALPSQSLFADVPSASQNAQGLTSGVKLQIKIDRITLHQYTRAEQGRFARALSRELTGLAQSQAEIGWGTRSADVVSAGFINIDRLDAGQLGPGASVEEAARRISQDIFASARSRYRTTKGDHA